MVDQMKNPDNITTSENKTPKIELEEILVKN